MCLFSHDIGFVKLYFSQKRLPSYDGRNMPCEDVYYVVIDTY